MFASKRTRSFIVRAAAVVTPLMLAACSADLGPGPMPTGYAHQGEVYKSQPGPRPVLMKDHMLKNQEREVQRYHPQKHDMMAHAPATAHHHGNWDSAAQDLVGRLVHELGKPMETVFVVPGAYPDLESALRHAMQGRGINVSMERGHGPFTLQYVVAPITDSSMVSITLLSVGAAVKEVSGIYNIATHGFSAAPVMDHTSADDVSAPLPILPVPAGNQ